MCVSGGGGGVGGDGEEREREEEEEAAVAAVNSASRVNTQPLTLINLPFFLIRVGVYGKEVGGLRKKSSVIIYAHGCTPINCREGGKKKKES